jgi:hypothetical protein
VTRHRYRLNTGNPAAKETTMDNPISHYMLAEALQRQTRSEARRVVLLEQARIEREALTAAQRARRPHGIGIRGRAARWLHRVATSIDPRLEVRSLPANGDGCCCDVSVAAG